MRANGAGGVDFGFGYTQDWTLDPDQPDGFAWMSGDLNAAGTVGEAAKATPEKGRATAEHQASGFVELLGDLRKAKLSEWIVD